MFTTIRNTVCIATLALGALFGTEALAAAPGSPDDIEMSVGESDRFAAAVDLEGQININTASATQLAMLPGVGPTIAERIISYRTKRPFKEAKHLLRVKGVGSKTYGKVKSYLSVEGETTLHVAK